jgi:hypothetical protein
VVQSCSMIDIDNKSSNFDVLLCEKAHINWMKLNVID